MFMLRTWLAIGLFTIWPAAAESTPAPSSSLTPTYTGLVDPAVDSSAMPSTGFTLTSPVQVPGRTLSAGAYTIRVMGQLSDRMIVRVERNGKPETTFLALPKSGLNGTAGPIRLNNGNGKTAMRGFVFPDGTIAEFVYPKTEAVGLAKANSTTIPAIDPVSDGRKDSPNLSNDDLQMVTLWMLSPAPVGPGGSNVGIKAAKYQMPAPRAAKPVEVAQADPSTIAVPARRPRPKAVMTVLPHTASELPVIELAGLVSLCGAAFLSRRRLTR